MCSRDRREKGESERDSRRGLLLPNEEELQQSVERVLDADTLESLFNEASSGSNSWSLDYLFRNYSFPFIPSFVEKILHPAATPPGDVCTLQFKVIHLTAAAYRLRPPTICRTTQGKRTKQAPSADLRKHTHNGFW